MNIRSACSLRVSISEVHLFSIVELLPSHVEVIVPPNRNGIKSTLEREGRGWGPENVT